jgi:hypothetical protein
LLPLNHLWKCWDSQPQKAAKDFPRRPRPKSPNPKNKCIQTVKSMYKNQYIRKILYIDMVVNILFQIFISIIIIFSLHYLYNYFKNTYSTKKTKNIVDIQVQKYQDILNELQQNQTTNITFLSDEEKNKMNDELSKLIQ